MSGGRLFLLSISNAFFLFFFMATRQMPCLTIESKFAERHGRLSGGNRQTRLVELDPPSLVCH